MTIPIQLQNDNIKLIRIGYENAKTINEEKSPIDFNWQNSIFNHKSPVIIEWLNTGHNVGVICQEGIIGVVDIDKLQFKHLINELPETFTVETPSRNGIHVYFKPKEGNTGIKYYKHAGGEVRISNAYVVAPGSYISTGEYKIVRDLPIAEISIEDIKKFFPKTSETIITEDGEFILPDETRSGREFGEVIRLIKQGKSKEEIFSTMMMFAKWSTADPRYREHTYKKALTLVEEEMKKVEIKIIENRNEESIRTEFCELMFGKDRRTHQATELLVKYIKSKETIYNTKVDIKKETWIYITDGENEGLTIPNGGVAIKEMIRKVLGIYYSELIYNQVMAKIEADTYVDYDSFFNTSYDKLSAVKNGILNIETKELLPFNSNYIFFKKADMNYNPASKCEEYIKFLDNLGVKREFIFELMATALLKENRMKKMAIFNGEADNGKSTLLETFRIIFGQKFCTAVPLHMLKQDSFALDKLRGAKFNIAGDIPDKDTDDIGSIKSLTGYDTVTVQRKFLPSIDTTLSVQHIFSCNKLPLLKKADKAFFNRVALIDFPYKFITQTEYDLLIDKGNTRIAKKGVLQEILTESEKSGILNEILSAYERIMKYSEFTLDRSSEQVKMIWVRRSNSFVAFCLDHVEEQPGYILSKSLLRYIYGIYCKTHKVSAMSDYDIKNILTKDYAANGDTRIDNEHIWEGVSLKNLAGLPGVLTLYENNYKKFIEYKKGGYPDVFSPQTSFWGENARF